jgi:hypothetical protein
MKVFRFEQDADRWRYLVPKGAKYMEVFGADPIEFPEGCSRAATWKPPPVEWIDPDGEECDFSMPDSGALIVHSRAYEVLRPLLAEAGELLPVQYKKETYYFLHVTRYVDALDLSAAKLLSDGEIKRYAFVPKKLADVSLFKIATTSKDGAMVMDLELYLAEGHRGPAFDFRALMKAHGLRGLEFKKVWSNE